MLRLVVVVIVVVVSLGLAAPSALAQLEWMPCAMRNPAGGGYLSFSSATTAGNPAASGTGPVREMAGGPCVVDEVAAFAPKIVMFQSELHAAAARFDRFDGNAIAPVEVRGFGLTVTARLPRRPGAELPPLGGPEGQRCHDQENDTLSSWSLGFSVPWLHVETPGFDERGFGDAGLFMTKRVHVRETASKRPSSTSALTSWYEVRFGTMLPTGEEGLGFDDPTLFAGFNYLVGYDRGYRAWARPLSLLTVGAGYGHHLGESDLSKLEAGVGWQGSVGETTGAAFLFQAGLGAIWEPADEVTLDGAVRDGYFQASARAAVGFSVAHDKLQILVGGVLALNDEGLRDEFVPTITVVGRY